jgi:two-component system sensor histidine kinase RegB
MLFDSLTHPHIETNSTIENAVWLVQLRWVAAIGQLLSVAVVQWVLAINLPLEPLLSLIGLTALTNLGLSGLLRWYRTHDQAHSDPLPFPWLPMATMTLDLVALTGLLYWTGGLQNPFAYFYFVNLAVAGLILRPLLSWGLATVAILGATVLLAVHLPTENLSIQGLSLDVLNALPFFSLAKIGYWIAFTTCTCVVTYFINVLSNELRLRERQLQDAERQRASAQRLEAMATLAAGAGHELASPLSTIAVVSKELSRSLNKTDTPANIVRDVELIRSELGRCRDILDRMKSGAGDAAAERLNSITAAELLDEAIVGLRSGQRVHLLMTDHNQTATTMLPIQAAALAIRNLIQNALDSSPSDSQVQVSLDVEEGLWRLKIVDRGTGIAADILQRIGEPFFTTKEPGQGMGLGVFLTRNVIDRLGGSMAYQPNSPTGTICTVELPLR